jgi:anti-anti-sigma regulatory factor
MNKPVVSLLQGEEATILMLRGNARADAADLLLEQLLQSATNKDVLVDWESAEHVDPCVLQVLRSFQKLLGNRGFSLSVAKDNPAIREYLRLSGFADDFPLHTAQSADGRGTKPLRPGGS